MTNRPGERGFEPMRFFDLILPAILAEQGTRTAPIDAVVELVLDGAERAIWHVDFTEIPATIHRGPSDDAELCVVVHATQVAALVTGDLDVPAALANGTVALAGDTEILARIAEVFDRADTLTGMDILYAGVRRPGD